MPKAKNPDDDIDAALDAFESRPRRKAQDCVTCDRYPAQAAMLNRYLGRCIEHFKHGGPRPHSLAQFYRDFLVKEQHYGLGEGAMLKHLRNCESGLYARYLAAKAGDDG